MPRISTLVAGDTGRWHRRLGKQRPAGRSVPAVEEPCAPRAPGRHPTAAQRRKAGWSGQHDPERRPRTLWPRWSEGNAKAARRTEAAGARASRHLHVAHPRYGLAAQQSGTHLTEVVLDLFWIWLTPAGGRPIKA